MATDELFDITGKVATITGGAGVLCSTMRNLNNATCLLSWLPDIDEDIKALWIA